MISIYSYAAMLLTTICIVMGIKMVLLLLLHPDSPFNIEYYLKLGGWIFSALIFFRLILLTTTTQLIEYIEKELKKKDKFEE